MLGEGAVPGSCRLGRWVIGLELACLASGASESGRAQGLADEAAPRRVSRHVPTTVATMPFTNVSGRPEDEWLRKGIAATVAAGVEQLGYLSVVDWETLRRRSGDSTTMDSRGELAHARRVARQYKVSWLVAGGFQRLDDQLRFTARVVDVESGAVRVVAKVDGPIDDAFALQDRIVAELAAGLAGLAGSLRDESHISTGM